MATPMELAPAMEQVPDDKLPRGLSPKDILAPVFAFYGVVDPEKIAKVTLMFTVDLDRLRFLYQLNAKKLGQEYHMMIATMLLNRFQLVILYDTSEDVPDIDTIYEQAWGGGKGVRLADVTVFRNKVELDMMANQTLYDSVALLVAQPFSALVTVTGVCTLSCSSTTGSR